MNKLQNFMLGFRGELTRAQIEEHGRVRVERKTKSKVLSALKVDTSKCIFGSIVILTIA